MGLTHRELVSNATPGVTEALIERLDDVLVVDLSLERLIVSQRLRQVGDGLESLAFHPSGRFAVISCLDKGPGVATSSHLATVDLATRPVRLLNYIPVDPVPEGIEFTADGSKLFVQTTLANHIVVFDVDGMNLRHSPFVLRTGHARHAGDFATILGEMNA